MITKAKLDGMVGKPLTEKDCQILQQKWEEAEALKKEVMRNKKKGTAFHRVDDSTIIIMGKESFFIHANDDSIDVIELNNETRLKL